MELVEREGNQLGIIATREEIAVLLVALGNMPKRDLKEAFKGSLHIWKVKDLTLEAATKSFIDGVLTSPLQLCQQLADVLKATNDPTEL